MDTADSYSLFAGSKRAVSGSMTEITAHARRLLKQDQPGTVLVFHDQTGEQVEPDLRDTAVSPPRRRKPRPGRPKLGVVAREVTLLPRHWEWLNSQPGGASVALRRLVEQARRDNSGTDRIRRAREAAYRFMSAMAGNFPGFEEATRALFRGDSSNFAAQIENWPTDVRQYATILAAPSFDRSGRQWTLSALV
jgi:hypothetical protein